MLKPGFFMNEALAELRPMARLLYAGLWTIADRKGRLEDRPKRIKGSILPYDAVDIEALLNALQHAQFIHRYSVGEHRYIQIPAFLKHQHPHVKEPPSTIPAPDGTLSEHGPAPGEHGSGPAESLAVNGVGVCSPLGPPRGATHSHPFRSRKALPTPTRWQELGFPSLDEYSAEIRRIAEANGGSDAAWSEAPMLVKSQ